MSFGQPRTKNNINNETNIINPFEDAFPKTFFGDYSNPEFWSNSKTNEIVYQNPQNDEFIYHEQYDGIGIWFFNSKTMLFNHALISNYEGAKYQNKYKSFVTTSENKDGFLGLDPNWSVLDVSYYLEDWIVWNCNEFLNYDNSVIEGGIGRSITNEDINLKWGDYSLTTNKDLLENTKISEYKTLGDYLSIGTDDSELKYYFYFKDQPLSKKPIYSEEQKAWIYQIYPISKTIFPTNKIVIGNNVSNLDFHLNFRQKLSLNSDLNDFDLWAKNYLYQAINRDFIKFYGSDQIEHDYTEGYFPLESINQQNSSIQFYDANDNLINVNRSNLSLSEYQMIKVKLVVNSTPTSIAQEYNNIFFPKNELTLSFASYLNWWQILLICLASLVALFFLINLIILLYSVLKQNSLKS